MANQQADVRVRLSADGIQEVIAALRTVQNESNKVRKNNFAKDLFGGIKQLLPAIGIGSAIAGMVQLGREALNTANNIGNLSQKTGVSTETLSVFAYTANLANVSQETLESGLRKLAQSMDLASGGSTKQADAFRRLGISLEDVRNKNPGDMLVEIASAMRDKVPEGAQRSAIAMALFGNAGQELLPLLLEIANDGMGQLTERAQKLGVVFSREMVDAANRANNALGELHLAAVGAANQFLIGFAPTITNAMEDVTDAIAGDGKNQGAGAMTYFGRIVAAIVQTVIFSLEAVGKTIGIVVAQAIENFSSMGEILNKELHLDFKGAIGAAQDFMSRSKAMWSGYFKDIADQSQKVSDAWQNIFLGFNDATSKGGNGGGGKGSGSGSGGGISDPTQVAQARLALLRARVDQELSLIRARNNLEETENQNAYERGLESFSDYFAKREALIKSNTAAEVAALQKKIALAKQEPINGDADKARQQQEIEQLTNQIKEAQLNKEQQLGALQGQRYKAEKDAIYQNMELQQQLANAQGDSYRAALIALDEELAKEAEQMRMLGYENDQIKQQIALLRQSGEARAAFTKAQQDAQAEMNIIDLEKRRIQAEADNGQITQLAAQGKILAVERERLANLRALGEQMQKNADAAEKDVNGPLHQQAKQYKADVDDIASSLDRVHSLSTDLQNTMIGSGLDAMTQFFQDGLSGAKSFSEAFADMGKAVEQAILGMIARLIAFEIMLSILKAFSPAAATALEQQGPFGTGPIGGRASGGPVAPGSMYEVAENGPELLQQGGKVYLITGKHGGMVVPAAAGGGSSAAGAPAGAGGGVEVNVYNGSGQQATTRQRSDNGRQIIDVIIGEVAADIRSGGRVAQSIQGTYGVGRQGVKRT